MRVTVRVAVAAFVFGVVELMAAEPELEIRRPDPAATYAKPEFKAATEAHYRALKAYLDAEGVVYREIGPGEAPRTRFVLNVNEKEVQEMHGIGAFGKTVEWFLRDIRRRVARDEPSAVPSAKDADALQRLADAAVGTPDRTLTLEKGKTYRLTRPLRLDARHSGLTIDGNGAVVEAGRPVAGWRSEGDLLVADVPDWNREILSLWVNGRRAQLAQAPNGERARMKTMALKPLKRPYPFDPAKDGVSVNVKDLADVLASSEEERRDAFVDYTIAWFTPKCRLTDVYDNGDGTANLFARNVACLHGTARPDVRYVPFNFGPYEKKWSGEAGVVISNLRRLLDAPGEFFFDRKAGKLFYLPREGETAKSITAHFATLERALEIVGESPTTRVRDVTVKNVTFRYGRQDRNAPDGFEPASQAAARCGGFLHVTNAEQVRLEDIRVEHCDVYGVAFAGGVWDSSLIGSMLVDCGSGGVRVGVDYTVIPDGDDRADPRQSGYVSIVGNTIKGYGRWNRSGCGVTLFDVGNCRVEANDISDGFYTGISVGWTWNSPKAHTQNNRIVRNRIHGLGLGVIDDLAGIYVLGGESYGSVIAENDIRDIHRLNYGAWGIYLDSRAGNYLVESNRCENCDDGGFFKNQGVHNVVRGNQFLYGKYTQIGDEPADDEDIVFENNTIVYRAPAEVCRGHIPRITRGIWRNNTYRCENGPVAFGPERYTLEDLLRFGLEKGSSIVSSEPRVVLDLKPNAENARNSEGDFAVLKDGRILFAYSQFKKSGDDHGGCVIAARVSSDKGETWSAERVIAVNGKGTIGNAMSASLLRLKDGRLALFFDAKDTDSDGNIISHKMMQVSSDEGETWGPARDCSACALPAYRVLNNARVVRLSSGRILMPVAEHASKGKDVRSGAKPMCFYSDDDGGTWKASSYVSQGHAADGRAIHQQEPGVIELKDGRVMMWFRTNEGRQWLSYSSDGGVTWSAPEPSSLVSPLAPATIRRLTSGELLGIWNDHEGRADLQQAGPKWAHGVRTPLTLGLSTDEGRTWPRRRNLETGFDPKDVFRYWYCYTAVLELEDRFLLAYCAEDNLCRLRIVSVPRGWLPSASSR